MLSFYTAVTEFDHAAQNGLTANYDVSHVINVNRLSAFDITMVTCLYIAGLPRADVDSEKKL